MNLNGRNVILLSCRAPNVTVVEQTKQSVGISAGEFARRWERPNAPRYKSFASNADCIERGLVCGILFSVKLCRSNVGLVAFSERSSYGAFWLPNSCAHFAFLGAAQFYRKIDRESLQCFSC
jgi:hypothetical protein